MKFKVVGTVKYSDGSRHIITEDKVYHFEVIDEDIEEIDEEMIQKFKVVEKEKCE